MGNDEGLNKALRSELALWSSGKSINGREVSSIVGGMMSLSLKKVIQQHLLKSKAHIPFKLAILLLGVCGQEEKSPVYIRTSVREGLAHTHKKNDTKNSSRLYRSGKWTEGQALGSRLYLGS